MRFRKLRIAWSVAWGVVAILLIAMWMWSYWYVETILCKLGDDFLIYAGSLPGELGLTIASEESVEPWIVYTQPSDHWLKGFGDRWLKHTWAGFSVDANSAAILFPHWFLVSVLGAAAVIPWVHKVRWRFSLRTLLIATMLIAIVLGLIVDAVAT